MTLKRSDTRPNVMRIDLDALDLNLSTIRRDAPGMAIVASVKANAYGHGIVPIARRLAERGVEILATGSISDARAMREADITTPILMMGGTLPSGIPELLRHGLIPTVHGPELAEAVTTHATQRVSIYVKVDCGFGRLGIPLREAHRFLIELARHPRIEVAGLYTHLPFSDAAGREWARERIGRFDDLIVSLAKDGLHIPVTQARASSAILTGITDRCSAVSPGALLYGLAPLDLGSTHPPQIAPVMAEITSRLIQVSPSAGDRTPGFESRYAHRVRGATGVVPFGRVDGNRMPLPDRDAHMLIAGVKAPILGVSLEHCVLDLSDAPSARVGDEVVVLGHCGATTIAIEDIAHWQGAGVNDVLMSLDGRVAQVIAG